MKILINEGFEQLSKIWTTVPALKLQNTEGQGDSEMVHRLSDADVLISCEFKSTWRGSHQKSSLRVVHSTGAGIDGIDVISLPSGCYVCNVYKNSSASKRTVNRIAII